MEAQRELEISNQEFVNQIKALGVEVVEAEEQESDRKNNSHPSHK